MHNISQSWKKINSLNFWFLILKKTSKVRINFILLKFKVYYTLPQQ